MIQLHLSLQFAPFTDQARHRLALPRHQVARWIRYALKSVPNLQEAFLTVRVVDVQEGQTLNHRYRQKNYATNVLTFDYSSSPVLSADLVLCAPVVEKEAREQHKTLQAHYAHLVVHGALHALGFDHELSEQAAQEMEGLEAAILQDLGFKNPYAA